MHWDLPTQRAHTAQQARSLRLHNAAVASAAAGGRPATAGSPAGWIHPPGGRRGICTGRTYMNQMRGRRRTSSNGGGSARSRRSSGGGGGGGRVPARLTTRRNQAQHSRRQGRGPGRLRPGSASDRAADGSMAGELRLEADMAAGSRSFTAAPADAALMPRTPMSPLDEQAPAAHDADPASFWLADQVSFTVKDRMRVMTAVRASLNLQLQQCRPRRRTTPTLQASGLLNRRVLLLAVCHRCKFGVQIHHIMTCSHVNAQTAESGPGSCVLVFLLVLMMRPATNCMHHHHAGRTQRQSTGLRRPNGRPPTVRLAARYGSGAGRLAAAPSVPGTLQCVEHL